MSEEINIVGQLKFASQHLFNLIVFIGILYYFLKDIVVKFFSSRSLKISKEIQEAIGKGSSYIRKCSNPDLPQQIDHNDSFKLDRASLVDRMLIFSSN